MLRRLLTFILLLVAFLPLARKDVVEKGIHRQLSVHGQHNHISDEVEGVGINSSC